MYLVKYNEKYNVYLEKYFNHPDTPKNNKSHKDLKTNLYDNEKGILFLIIHDDEIIAVSSVILIKDNNIISAKFPHRLHVRSDYSSFSNKFIDEYFDPAAYEWLEEKNIKNVYCTFNEDNWMPMLWSSYRHSRRNKQKINLVNMLGQTIRSQEWYVYPKLIQEMNVWQFVSYSSFNGEWFYPWRDTKEINNEIKTKLDSNFTFILNKGWRI